MLWIMASTRQGFVINGRVFECLAHARYHADEGLEVAHFFDLLHLAEKVVEVKFVLLHPLQALGFLFIKIHLRLLHERDDVAHAEDFAIRGRGRTRRARPIFPPATQI